MQKVVGIGGVFFRAKDPKGLAGWYEDALGVDINDRTWVQQRGQTVFAPFRADTDYFGSLDQQWMLCFRVNDLAAMLEQLRAAGSLFNKSPNGTARSGSSRAFTILKETRSSFGSRRTIRLV
jgi:glyoxylase I family protein